MIPAQLKFGTHDTGADWRRYTREAVRNLSAIVTATFSAQAVLNAEAALATTAAAAAAPAHYRPDAIMTTHAKRMSRTKNPALASTGWRNSGAVVLKLVLKTPSEIPGTVLNLRSYVVRSIQLVVRAWAWFRLYFDREGRYWYSAANLMNLYICLQQRHF